MIDLKSKGLSDTKSLIVSDMIALANVEKKNNVDTKIISANSTTIVVDGEFENIENRYAVAGEVIVLIKNSTALEGKTTFNVESNQFGTSGIVKKGEHFRTVVMIDNELTLTAWEFEDTIGSVTSSLFPVELGTGTITMKSDLSLWSPHSLKQKYKVRPRKSMAYIFKGVDDVRVLKYTTVIQKVRFNTRGKSDPNRIILDIKNKLGQWYDKDVVLNKQLKGTTPKEFFKMAFDLTDDEVYYAEGVSEDSFPKINNLHTKEYSTMSELLKAYCQNGIRFCFDRFEKVKIFGDFNVDNISSQKTLEYNITDSMLTEDELMIYNTINTQSYQRQTMYNFEDLDNKYVKFFKVKNNAVDSNQFLELQENGDYTSKTIEIQDSDLHSSVQLKDYVLFKRTVEPLLEFYAMVIAIEKDNKVVVSPLLYDKDFKLLNLGKYSYLYEIMVGNNCPMDLYYVREELPMIFKYTRNRSGEEVDSSLMMPLLPRVDGETKYQTETNITFGCAENLKVGSYTGIVEEVDEIYGIWDNSKLLYNRELTQFSNINYPPIFVLTNKLEERLIDSKTPILNYTHFDNSNFLLEIERPRDNSCDAVVKMSNTISVNSSIDLYVGQEISRVGNQILEVEELTPFQLGDVLIANKPDDLNVQEETEFDEVLSSIRWRIIAKETQVSEDGTRKHYIYLDSPFAKRQQQGKVYGFTKFPNWSIVYLQELYFRGNPVIEFAQDVVGMSKGVNIDGDTSRDIYGEKKYELDSKQLNKENLRLLMGYILDHFQATNVNTTKFNVPISVFNGMDIELLDVVSVKDPVYTQIEETMKWVVVSVSSRANTSEVELKLLNVNSKNTEPYKIDIKDVIQYEPVEIPNYDHAGGEGNIEDNNDGTGGTQEDKTLGKFWLSEVDPSLFRAKVEKFEGNYIYFKDFSGQEYEQYQSKLFPESEFGVTIKGETIFVQSDMNYRAFIKKRRVYDTEETVIAPEDDVTFLVTTTYVDYDGTLYGRRAMFGDGDTYLSVHPINGVKVVGDFVVGENSKNPSNDLWQSLQNNRTFYQNDTPVDTVEYKIKKGDIWYDTNDGNHVYRYSGTVWQSCRDGSIVSAQSQTFIQPNEPISTEGRPLQENDTWYDSDDGYKPYIYKNGKWVNVSDTSLQDAIDKVQENVDKVNQELSDMANDDKLTSSEKQNTLKEWEQIKSEYILYVEEGTKFEVDTSLYTTSYNELDSYLKPLLTDMSNNSSITGSIFRNKFNTYYIRRQELLINIQDAINKKAEKAENDALESIKVNSRVFYQDEMPTDLPTYKLKENDLWYDIGDMNHPYVYSGSEWVSVRDGSILSKGGNRIYYQANEPQGTSEIPLNEGDIWIDSDEGNIQYVYHNKQWVDTRSQDVIDALDNARVFFQETEPTSVPNGYQLKVNDIWYNTSEKNHVYIYNGTKWISAQDGKIDEALQSSRVFRQNNKPVSDSNYTLKKGDLWYNVDDNNHLYIYSGTDWVDARDKSYITGGGNRVYFQDEQPTGNEGIPILKNDMWIDTNDNNHPYVYNGSKWLSSRDGSIIDINNAIYFQENPPVGTEGKPLREGDLWYDINDGNTPYVYKNGVWTTATDKKLEQIAKDAQASADKANSMLADISSDSKLTPNEKIQTLKEVETIKSEYPMILAEAQRFNVDTIKYTEQYTAVLDYTTPLLENMEETSDLVDPLEFRNVFIVYYYRKQNILNEIVNKSNESAIQTSKDYADSVIDSLEKDLTNQIDGKINSYSQTDDPSIEWITAEEKQKHIGDLWYNLILKITQRWNGNEWEEIEATDSTAQAIAESKRTVFVSQPKPPYLAGDLWVTNLTSTGDLKVCVTSRESGSFVDTDWVLATKYTDDTVANQAQEKAEEALNDALSATNKINEMSSDNKLSPIEKQNTKKEWDEIQGEYQKNIDQALLFGVSYTTYESSYNTLNSYLTPLLSNLEETSDIVGTTFREQFKNYYNSRQDLLNSISLKAKELADNAQEDATTALGNAKIFYQNDPPTSGMKERDLWYDTNDQNHPYVYINGKWTSARDKIFETESGNKVYFQATKPPSSGTGVKEGDIWFDTANNNTQYVLIKQSNGTLTWTLASDANDKIAKGEVVINANTIFNGDATIVSQGEDETTIIKGGSITFTRGGVPITVIRNMRVGTIATDGSGKGIITFNNFKTLNVLTSIKSFNVGSNVRSLNTYANLIDPYLNKWQFFLYGTESEETASTKYTHSFSVYNTTFSISYLRIYGSKLLMRVSNDTKIGSISVSDEGLGISSSSCRVSSTVSYSGSITKSNSDGIDTIASLNGKLTGYVWARQTGSTSWDLYFYGTYDIPLSLSSSNTKNLNTILKIDFSKFSVSWTANGSITGKPSGSASQSQTIPFTRNGTYNDARNLLTNNVFEFGYTQTEIVNTIGDGDVQYIAMEV